MPAPASGSGGREAPLEARAGAGRANVATSRERSIATAYSLAAGILLAFPAGAAFPGLNGRVAYAARDQSQVGSPSALFVDGVGQITFATQRSQQDYFPTFSPDGTRIAFFRTWSFRDFAIGTVPATGGIARSVISMGSFPGATTLEPPAWTPDGLGLTFGVVGSNPAVNGIWTQRLVTGERTLIVPWTSAFPRPVFNLRRNWSWSARTHELVYACHLDDQLRYGLCIYDGDSSAGRVLPLPPVLNSPSVFQPQWTPDGRRIVFELKHVTFEGANGHSVKRSDVAMIHADGKGFRILTDSGPELCPDASVSEGSAGSFMHAHPTPSPDGRSLLLVRAPVRIAYTSSGTRRDCGNSGNNTGAELFRLHLLDLASGSLTPFEVDTTGPHATNDWQPLPSDLTARIDDGHGNGLQGLRVELRKTTGEIVALAEDKGGGAYALDDVAAGTYRLRATLVDQPADAFSDPRFDVRYALDTTDEPVWIEAEVTMRPSEDRVLVDLSFVDWLSIVDASVEPADRHRLDDMANVYFRLRQ